MKNYYELVIFTASIKKSKIEFQIIKKNKYTLIKDLKKFGRNLKDMIIVNVITVNQKKTKNH